jgi:hypothetical protein
MVVGSVVFAGVDFIVFTGFTEGLEEAVAAAAVFPTDFFFGVGFGGMVGADVLNVPFSI